LELFWDSWSVGFLGDRLYQRTTVKCLRMLSRWPTSPSRAANRTHYSTVAAAAASHNGRPVAAAYRLHLCTGCTSAEVQPVRRCERGYASPTPRPPLARRCYQPPAQPGWPPLWRMCRRGRTPRPGCYTESNGGEPDKPPAPSTAALSIALDCPCRPMAAPRPQRRRRAAVSPALAAKLGPAATGASTGTAPPTMSEARAAALTGCERQ